MATIPLGLYLWRRIKEIGISSVMGVPGDFNLELLDYIYEVPGLRWMGNANELNSAYAADGYARVKGVPGCLVTTHGVGELSALNGVAGAMTEQVKLIHVVGQTSRKMQRNHMMIHHSIGPTPDHQVYNKMSEPARVAAAELLDEKTAPAEIDRVIRDCFLQSAPVYIFIPIDMVMKQVPESLLETKIDITPPVNERGEKEAIDAILDAIYQAKNPLVFVDALVHRHNAKKEASKLVDILAFPTYAANMGKTIIDETHPSYVGIYNGRVSTPGLYEAVEASDLALVLGSIPSDTNSGGFTRTFHDAKCIQINPHSVVIGSEKWLDVHMKPLLARLASTITKSSLPKAPKPRLGSRPAAKDIDAKHITQSYIWDRIAAFLRPGDVLLADTGTAAFGLPDATFPKDVIFITQTYYGSIGYCTPAALGSDVALSELHAEQGKSRGRTILVTGDGSLQLTIQEVGTMIARGFQPIIMIINNAGYTIERVIHGARQPYNDIVAYDYSHMLSLFGASKSEATSNFHHATTKEEFEAICNDPSVQDPTGVKVVEVVMDMMDVPWRLMEQIALRGPETVRKLKEASFMQ